MKTRLIAFVCMLGATAWGVDETPVVVTADKQTLASVSALYRLVTGRTLLTAADIQAREVSLGPFNAPKSEALTIIQEALRLQGFTVRKMTETTDIVCLAAAAPPEPVAAAVGAPVTQEIKPRLSRLFVLTSASAQDVLEKLNLVFGSSATAAVVGNNSLFVRAEESELTSVEACIAGCDSLAPLVRVRAILGRVTLGGEYQTGLDWLAALEDFTVGNQGVGMIDAPLRATTQALTVYGAVGSLSRYLKLTEEDKDFRVESRPSLFVRSGSSAEITSGQRVPYPQTTLTQATGNVATAATVAYQDVLLKLKIDAVVNGGRIRLKIEQANDTIAGTATIGANQVPSVASQTLTTEVELQSGGCVALGGIVTTLSQHKERGVSKLRRIPVLGRLFETRTRSTTEEELVILLEATVSEN